MGDIVQTLGELLAGVLDNMNETRLFGAINLEIHLL